MVLVDYIVLLVYAAGLLGVGLFYATRVKTTSDMFAAGGQSPWWMSGLSAFMTMFSAGTFVVWGGIAYRYGMVAVSISLCYGIAALLVGWTLAGRWRRLGVSSAAEFLHIRFGASVVQFYTWLQGIFGMFGMGLSIYGLSVIVCTLIPVAPDHALAFLADPETGRLSVTYLSIALCAFVVVITFGGGLWAVLMTDVLQFIVLTVSVVFVVPLIFSKLGGVSTFVEQAPEGFLKPTAGDFTWWFLLGWIAVHYFHVGGKWAFVQRFTCVPTPRDARRSAFLFAGLYLVSPLFWMLPPMVYRLLQPIPDGLDEAAINALQERAYIRACELVLPAGMVGLMVAAMASATASMATTQLNVYAGALTEEVYQKLLRPQASDRELLTAGRLLTLLLGGVVLAGAVIIPAVGTYTSYIIAFTAMLTGPLVLPTIWGLFSRRLSLAAVWVTTLLGGSASIMVKFAFSEGGWLDGVAVLSFVTDLVQRNKTVTDLVVGTSVTLLGLAVAELTAKGDQPGWAAVEARRRAAERALDQEEANPVKSSPLPALICGVAVMLIALMMGGLAILDAEQRVILLMFAVFLGLISAAILGASRWRARRSPVVPDH